MIQFNKAWDSFMLAKRVEEISQKHFENYALTRTYWLQQYPALALDEITPQHVREWLAWLQSERNGKQLKSTSVHLHFRNLKCFLLWCERQTILAISPMRRVETPKYQETEREVLTEREVYDLLEAVKNSGDRHAFRDYVIHLFLFDTGVRLNELVNIDLDDVNQEVGYVNISYGKRHPTSGYTKRVVALGLTLRQELNLYLLKHRPTTDERALWLNEHGKRFDRDGIRSMIVRDLQRYVARRLGNYGPHTHRHTCITLDLRHSGDINKVAMKAGHRDITTTKRYVHLAMHDLVDQRGSAMDALKRGKGARLQKEIRHT